MQYVCVTSGCISVAVLCGRMGFREAAIVFQYQKNWVNISEMIDQLSKFVLHRHGQKQ